MKVDQVNCGKEGSEIDVEIVKEQIMVIGKPVQSGSSVKISPIRQPALQQKAESISKKQINFQIGQVRSTSAKATD